MSKRCKCKDITISESKPRFLWLLHIQRRKLLLSEFLAFLSKRHWFSHGALNVLIDVGRKVQIDHSAIVKCMQESSECSIYLRGKSKVITCQVSIYY